jgi:hypothetical protein
MISQVSAKEHIRSMRIIFAVLVTGVIIFALIVAGVNYVDGPVMSAGIENNIITGITVIIAIICLAVGNMMFKKGVAATRNLTGSLNHKLGIYRSLLIRYMATCEAPAIFSILMYALTADARALAITVIVLIAMWMARPTDKKITQDLELDWKDQEAFIK